MKIGGKVKLIVMAAWQMPTWCRQKLKVFYLSFKRSLCYQSIWNRSNSKCTMFCNCDFQEIWC